jgi:hypothetical protein
MIILYLSTLRNISKEGRPRVLFAIYVCISEYTHPVYSRRGITNNHSEIICSRKNGLPAGGLGKVIEGRIRYIVFLS